MRVGDWEMKTHLDSGGRPETPSNGICNCSGWPRIGLPLAGPRPSAHAGEADRIASRSPMAAAFRLQAAISFRDRGRECLVFIVSGCRDPPVYITRTSSPNSVD